MNQQEIIINLDIIRQEIDKEVSPDSGAIELMLEKLNDLSTLIGLSAECKAAAKSLLLEKQAGHLLSKMRDTNFTKLSWNLQKIIIESDLKDYVEIYEYADRLNVGIVHCSDMLRTIISRNKLERELEAKAGWGQR